MPRCSVSFCSHVRCFPQPPNAVDMPSRFSRPAGGGSRLTPAGLGGDGSNGGTHGGNGGGSGGNGGSGGSGSGSGSGNPDDEPLRLSSVAPWAVAYAGLCAVSGEGVAQLTGGAWVWGMWGTWVRVGSGRLQGR